MGKMFSNNINVDYLNNTVDIAQHDGSAKGLKLANTLVTATAAEINALAGQGAVAADMAKLHAIASTAAEIDAVAKVSTRVVNCTASTLTISAATHASKLITLNRAAGTAVTLPNATGTGNIYQFIVGTAISGGTTTITRGTTADCMIGLDVVFSDNAANAVIGFFPGSTDNVITMDGSTQGGYAGAYIKIVDIATNQWWVEMRTKATGTEATPFSHT